MEQTPSDSPAPHRQGSLESVARRAMRGWRWVGPLVLIAVGAVIATYPLWPKIQYALYKPLPTLPYQTRLATGGQLISAVTLSGLPVAENKPIPADNRLVIPSIGVDMTILEGPTQKVLDRGGIWHLPNTSDPIAGGNMVLSGHRWMYLPPSSRTLYLLDKVKIGEPVIVYWQGVEYDYRIDRREVVDPSRTDILNDTTIPQLTIFTCTPLFSTKLRLVLYGTLIS
ncbi:MAG: sortase [Patescibacteria group bacterium]